MAGRPLAPVHETEPWNLNPEGPRSIEEAVALARAHGIAIPDDIRFDIVEEFVPEGAHAAYAQLGKQAGTALIRWEQFYNRFGKIPVHLRQSVLASDEAIIAVFAHEVHELTNLRRLFDDHGGFLTAGALSNLISPAVHGNLHYKAVQIGDALVLAMRETS
jgi:hypothetical protein